MIIVSLVVSVPFFPAQELLEEGIKTDGQPQDQSNGEKEWGPVEIKIHTMAREDKDQHGCGKLQTHREMGKDAALLSALFQFLHLAPVPHHPGKNRPDPGERVTCGELANNPMIKKINNVITAYVTINEISSEKTGFREKFTPAGSCVGNVRLPAARAITENVWKEIIDENYSKPDKNGQ